MDGYYSLRTIQTELYSLGNAEKVGSIKRYFKTEKGQYAEPDVFLGISVPQLRFLSAKYLDSILDQLQIMLSSKFHEERMLSLLILVKKFQKSKSQTERDEIFRFYIASKNIIQVNNWDLVDTSCSNIIGAYLMDNPLHLCLLTKFSRSSNIWVRRISIVSTFEFIRRGKFDVAFEIVKLLLGDNEDMIQKAVGWMLREIGKRDKDLEIKFLIQHQAVMPHKVMRYATENFNAFEKDSLR